MHKITETMKNLIEFLNENLYLEGKKNETIKEFNNRIKDCLEKDLLEKHLLDIKQQQDEFLLFLELINTKQNMLDLLDSPNLELIEQKIKELPKPLTLTTTELQKKINLLKKQSPTKKPIITVKTDPSVHIAYISSFATQYGYTIQRASVPQEKLEKHFYTITKQLTQSSQENQPAQPPQPGQPAQPAQPPQPGQLAPSLQSTVDLATFNDQGVMTIPIKTNTPAETYREQLTFLINYLENLANSEKPISISGLSNSDETGNDIKTIKEIFTKKLDDLEGEEKTKYLQTLAKISEKTNKNQDEHEEKSGAINTVNSNQELIHVIREILEKQLHKQEENELLLKNIKQKLADLETEEAAARNDITTEQQNWLNMLEEKQKEIARLTLSQSEKTTREKFKEEEAAARQLIEEEEEKTAIEKLFEQEILEREQKRKTLKTNQLKQKEQEKLKIINQEEIARQLLETQHNIIQLQLQEEVSRRGIGQEEANVFADLKEQKAAKTAQLNQEAITKLLYKEEEEEARKNIEKTELSEFTMKPDAEKAARANLFQKEREEQETLQTNRLVQEEKQARAAVKEEEEAAAKNLVKTQHDIIQLKIKEEEARKNIEKTAQQMLSQEEKTAREELVTTGKAEITELLKKEKIDQLIISQKEAKTAQLNQEEAARRLIEEEKTAIQNLFQKTQQNKIQLQQKAKVLLDQEAAARNVIAGLFNDETTAIKNLFQVEILEQKREQEQEREQQKEQERQIAINQEEIARKLLETQQNIMQLQLQKKESEERKIKDEAKETRQLSIDFLRKQEKYYLEQIQQFKTDLKTLEIYENTTTLSYLAKQKFNRESTMLNGQLLALNMSLQQVRNQIAQIHPKPVTPRIHVEQQLPLRNPGGYGDFSPFIQENGDILLPLGPRRQKGGPMAAWRPTTHSEQPRHPAATALPGLRGKPMPVWYDIPSTAPVITGNPTETQDSPPDANQQPLLPLTRRRGKRVWGAPGP